MVEDIKVEGYLEGKNAVVTGAAQGIGNAIACEIARRGANVAILDINEEKAKLAAKEIEKYGTKVFFFLCDITNYEQLEKTFLKINEIFGGIHILVNNAGINKRKPLQDLTKAEWDAEIAVNLSAIFYCSKIAAEYMVKQREGWIVNIASFKAKESATSPGYTASKHGVLGLTKNFAKDLIKYNIHVNAVSPGPTETDMAKLWDDKTRQKYVSQIPRGRLGQPEDIAYVVSFLCSPYADFIVGASIDVNGGYLMF